MELQPTGLAYSNGTVYVLLPGFRAEDFEGLSDYEFERDQQFFHVFLERPDGVVEQVSTPVDDESMMATLGSGFENVVVTDPANIDFETD